MGDKSPRKKETKKKKAEKKKTVPVSAGTVPAIKIK